MTFVGLKNYAAIFADQAFRRALVNNCSMRPGP